MTTTPTELIIELPSVGLTIAPAEPSEDYYAVELSQQYPSGPVVEHLHLSTLETAIMCCYFAAIASMPMARY